MTRPPYHPVRPTRPRPGRVPKQRSAPPPTSTGGKNTAGGVWCPLAIPALPLLLLFTAARYLTRRIVPVVPLALAFTATRYLKLPIPPGRPRPPSTPKPSPSAAGARPHP